MPPLQPLPAQIIVASKLREEAKRLNLLADELEASAGPIRQGGDKVFLFGEVRPRKRRKA